MKHAPFLAGVALLAQSATAAAPMRALIIDGQNNQDWQHTTPVLKKILEDTGRFRVDVLTAPPKDGDFSGFRPEFKKYAVVVSNYNEFPNGSKWPDEVMTSFEEYMSGGGGSFRATPPTMHSPSGKPTT